MQDTTFLHGILSEIPNIFLIKLFKKTTPDTSQWIIEGHGVEPDIEVWNDPWKEFNGEDQQLNKAIEIAMKKLEENPPVIPGVPDFPDKSK
ncbi:MAG: hypothetical protein ACP5DZ_07120 [Bacteroidales bacterium]